MTARVGAGGCDSVRSGEKVPEIPLIVASVVPAVGVANSVEDKTEPALASVEPMTHDE